MKLSNGVSRGVELFLSSMLHSLCFQKISMLVVICMINATTQLIILTTLSYGLDVVLVLCMQWQILNVGFFYLYWKVCAGLVSVPEHEKEGESVTFHFKQLSSFVLRECVT